MSPISSALSGIVLALLHAVYYVYNILKCLLPRGSPQDLAHQRRQMPRHVALLLHVDPADEPRPGVVADLLECVRRAIEWCEASGAETLIVYDERGECR